MYMCLFDKARQQVVSFVIAVCAVISQFAPAALLASDSTPQLNPFSSFAPSCGSAILMEAQSGQILYEYNSHESLPPASMVKIFVAYMIAKMVEDGQAKLDDVVTTSAFASKVGGSQVYLAQGEQFTLEELLEALLIQSANDAAAAMAEHLAGSTEAFVDMMNMEAQALGLRESTFHSPHGLPPARDQQPDLMSAHDLAQVSRHIIVRYPQLLELTSINEKGFRNDKFGMRNHNDLIRKYQGCDGLKTGYYARAGFGVAATAKRAGVRLISVVMKCPSKQKRFNDATRLFSLGFAQFRNVKLAEKGTIVETKVPVINGRDRFALLVTAGDVNAALLASEKASVKEEANPCKSLSAPVPAGTACGTVSYVVGDKKVANVELVTGKDIPKAGLTDKFYNFMDSFFR